MKDPDSQEQIFRDIRDSIRTIATLLSDLMEFLQESKIA